MLLKVCDNIHGEKVLTPPFVFTSGLNKKFILMRADLDLVIHFTRTRITV